MSALPERGVVFRCGGEELIGILHPASGPCERGVLVVVGGPQYRVGSHRQFVLLARHLAATGIPAMRFDYRGMGDAGGALRTFEEAGADIAAAIDVFLSEVEGLREVVLWGLCDAASAAVLHASDDPRVAGIVLVNPWVRTERGAAQAVLRHYYWRRLLQPELWHKLATLRMDWRGSLKSFVTLLRRAIRAGNGCASRAPDTPLPERLAARLTQFRHPLLFVLSGRDLVAAEFRDRVEAMPQWQAIFARPDVMRIDLPEADHTFSSTRWRDEVAVMTVEWLRKLPVKALPVH